MFLKFFLLFTIGPVVELYLLIKVGGMIGALNTVILILLTGLIGAAMAQSQGLSVIAKIKEATEQGRIPAEELMDGIFILVGGFLLITPGFISDLIGFSCLIPWTRALYRMILKKYLQKQTSHFQIHIDMRDRS